ncbi:acyl-CoA dehydrogenase [Aeromicrobium sp. PE09-221]|uniref:acyl-CoA dehydrogenase family protein n=1 Tax=Aeromicrobium sp. PE09-221 TaxID=1898043 RepID=UPI000B3E9926|nr:acyl-CoA dehydrogenase family protein [Aeromicrobium sp. PE09-221]OUZ10135.1 acyl-CoA dehydrogenase [Aeromicrobium sp. PE09-221]
MRISYTESQERFRREVREYYADLLTPQMRAAFASAEESGTAYREAVRRLGEDGWLTVSWPREYGGRGLSPMESYIFFEETQRAGVTIPHLTTNSVGPTLMRFGTEEQRSYFLPRIARGDLHFSIGYSEPDAGSDLAALQTRAVRDGDHYVINGQKIFTSLIQHADFVWLAVRTDPDEKRHRGISILIVPTDAPGFSWTPIHTLRGGFTSATYYHDVRVPVGNLVGTENEGWQLITSQLNAERVTICPVGVVYRRLEEVLAWARRTEAPDGRRMIDQEWVQMKLAIVEAKAEALQLLNWRIAWAAEHGEVSGADASAIKVYGTEMYVEVFRHLMDIVGEDALLAEGTPGALPDSLEAAMRWSVLMTFGGGTNEVQREIIARAGLGMSRAAR